MGNFDSGRRPLERGFDAADAKLVKDEIYPLLSRLNILKRRVGTIPGGGPISMQLGTKLFEATKALEQAIVLMQGVR